MIVTLKPRDPIKMSYETEDSLLNAGEKMVKVWFKSKFYPGLMLFPLKTSLKNKNPNFKRSFNEVKLPLELSTELKNFSLKIPIFQFEHKAWPLSTGLEGRWQVQRPSYLMPSASRAFEFRDDDDDVDEAANAIIRRSASCQARALRGNSIHCRSHSGQPDRSLRCFPAWLCLQLDH